MCLQQIVIVIPMTGLDSHNFLQPGSVPPLYEREVQFLLLLGEWVSKVYYSGSNAHLRIPRSIQPVWHVY